MNKNLLIISHLVLLLTTIGVFGVQGQSANSVARSMFDKTDKINTLTYTMIKKERIDGELQEQIANVKLQREPFMVYTRQETPEEGLEILYKKGDKTALINPNGFPWFNVRLDPTGSRMTKDQHHTIMDSGFDRFISILEHLFDKYENDIESIAHLTSHTNKEGKDCWKLSFDNPYFKTIDYTVKENENLLDIGYKRLVSSYMIMLLNKDVEDYNDVKQGQVIKIPNDYSPKMNLLIDKELLVPVEIEVYFENEVFELYQFANITINPEMDPAEFRPEYSGYGF